MSDAMGTREASEKWGMLLQRLASGVGKDLSLMSTKIKKAVLGTYQKTHNVPDLLNKEVRYIYEKSNYSFIDIDSYHF